MFSYNELGLLIGVPEEVGGANVGRETPGSGSNTAYYSSQLERKEKHARRPMECHRHSNTPYMSQFFLSINLSMAAWDALYF